MSLISVTANSIETKDKILINGLKPLIGRVRISGAKNAVLKQIAASILIPHPVILKDVPALQDVYRMIDILHALGAKCEFDEKQEILKINCSTLSSSYAPFELVSRLRASFVILGPILARCGNAKVSLPGGCQIGTRRIDLHEKGLKSLGAHLEITHGYVEAHVPEGGLIGKEIHLDIPSNGATENLMMAAVLAKGNTIIENAAKDPEIEDLANFLNCCGAKITGAGSHRIEIEGVTLNDLHSCEYTTLPDRIEAGTFIIAVLATGGKAIIDNVISKHLTALLSKLEEMGAVITPIGDKSLEVSSNGRLKATEISTVWYPGFPTDLQPQMMALLTKTDGVSILKENIYEDRFSHVEELVRMGADIQVNNHIAILKGVDKLTGAPVTGSDLRATAGLIIAGLAADGISEVRGLNHLDRGYNSFADKLSSLGADIQRISE